jgi:hypothetical protein
MTENKLLCLSKRNNVNKILYYTFFIDKHHTDKETIYSLFQISRHLIIEGDEAAEILRI